MLYCCLYLPVDFSFISIIIINHIVSCYRHFNDSFLISVLLLLLLCRLILFIYSAFTLYGCKCVLLNLHVLTYLLTYRRWCPGECCANRYKKLLYAVATASVVAKHGSFNYIRQVAPIWTFIRYNGSYNGPTRVGNSIGSVVWPLRWHSTTPIPTRTSSRGRKIVAVLGESVSVSASWNASFNTQTHW